MFQMITAYRIFIYLFRCYTSKHWMKKKKIQLGLLIMRKYWYH